MASNDEVLASLRGRPRPGLQARASGPGWREMLPGDRPGVGQNPIDYFNRFKPDFENPYTKMFTDRLEGVSYDPSGVQAFKERALQAGESPWARMMREKVDMEQGRALGSAGAQAAGATSGAMSNLAMRGGLSRGAAERLARGGMRDMAQARQDIYGRGAGQRLDVGIEDERQRLAALGALPGLQMEEYKTRIGGISPWMDLSKNLQGFQGDMFKARMATEGAGKVADTIASAYGVFPSGNQRQPARLPNGRPRPNLLA